MIQNFTPKEISWLSFNQRVLQEAQDETVPLIERIKFLGIYSNNLDEFFRVRVAILKRLSKIGKKAEELVGDDPIKIIKEIQDIVLQQRFEFDKTYQKIRSELEKENIFILNEKQLSPEQGKYVQKLFQKKIQPFLIPIMLNQVTSFPKLKEEAIYLAIDLENKINKNIQNNYAIIEIPNNLPRFIELPCENDKITIIFLDDVIRYELADIFRMFEFDNIEAYTIKLTRDAELDINDDLSESYVKKISRSLQQRKEGRPVRFLYDSNIPSNLLDFFIKKLRFKKEDAIIGGGRYHNFKDLIGFPSVGKPHLKHKPLPPFKHKDLLTHNSILDSIKEKDILLHFPYHDFNQFIDILREASIDPKVNAIKITIYRVGKNSSVVNSLINAAKNGKQVTVLIELQARFDEEANIKWGKKMQEAGVKVIYGVNGLKVHAKLCHITRKEGKKEVNYSCIGTGNFNEDSAGIFSDHLLLTANTKLTNEVEKVFVFLDRNYKKGMFRHLIVSPFYLRSKLLRMIRNEINLAKAGNKAYIYIKLNNLADMQLINKLYDAAKAGVEVKLNIRGMFSVTPNIDENINIESIAIIDRFLEHSRIYVFGNNGDEKMYISSADCMARNLDRRVEVTCPIYDKNIKKEITDFMNFQWEDNVKVRILDNKQTNIYRKNKGKKIQSQVEIYNYLYNKTAQID